MGDHTPPVWAAQIPWAQAMGLLAEKELTPLAEQMLAHDPELASMQSRGICYVELVANTEAVAIVAIARHLFSDWRWWHPEEPLTLQEVIRFFVQIGVGTDETYRISLQAEQERRREALRFLRALCDPNGFGNLGLLNYQQTRGYYLRDSSCLPAVTAYAVRRWWPSSRYWDRIPYLSYMEVASLVSPLRLSPDCFKAHLALLEARGWMLRVTSCGLDQVWPVWDRPIEDLLWPGTS